MSDFLFIAVLFIDFWTITGIIRKKFQTSFAINLVLSFLILIFKIYLLVFILGLVGKLAQFSLSVLWGISLFFQVIWIIKKAKKSLVNQIVILKTFFFLNIWKNIYLLFLFILISAVFIYLALVVFLLLPADIDGLSYHLGYVGYLRQIGDIFQVNSQFIWIN